MTDFQALALKLARALHDVLESEPEAQPGARYRGHAVISEAVGAGLDVMHSSPVGNTPARPKHTVPKVEIACIFA